MAGGLHVVADAELQVLNEKVCLVKQLLSQNNDGTLSQMLI